MARRPKKSDFQVSLFPFLSVLSCVIGTLTLMIAASAIGRVAEDMEDDPSTLPSAEVVLLEESDLDAMKARVDEAFEVEAELEGFRSQLRAAGFEAEDEDALLHRVRQGAKLLRLRQKTGELEQARLDLDSALEGVREQERDHRQKSKQAPISIQPRGEGSGLLPFFVECSEEGLQIHRPGSGRVAPLRIDDLAEAARFQAFLRRVRVTQGGTVIFLVRPDGVSTYYNALREVEKLTVRHGKMPLPGDGPLDFSLF